MRSKLTELRKSVGLTQRQVADRFGLVRSAVARWETGKSAPRSVILPELAVLYNCRIEDLLDISENPPATETA